MLRFRSFARHLGAIIYTMTAVLLDVVWFLILCLRPAPTLAAENLFLRRQLAQYQERHVKPRRANDATRISLVWLRRFFDWRKALVIVQPATLIRWHRQSFRWFWRGRSKPGRPVLPDFRYDLPLQPGLDERGRARMISFQGAHFPKDIMLMGVRWYVAYPLSYRHVEDLMAERGVPVDHATLQRWVVKYSSLLEEAFHGRKRLLSVSWHMDETYITVKAEWRYFK